jgi:hypothetical protein
MKKPVTLPRSLSEYSEMFIYMRYRVHRQDA